jgi:uncharacterized iron-regulated protein
LPPAQPGPPLLWREPFALLGEVHDNAAGHALRLAAFRQVLLSGARPVLALEQFDRSKQPALDRALASTPRPDADALIAAAGAPGWNWDHYRPFIALALDNGLPIVAANVSRDEARAIMRDGLAAHGFDARVPDDVLTRQASEIEASHCGMLDAATARRLALAQVARDQFMARVLVAQAAPGMREDDAKPGAADDQPARGVVLLAGNGHVRTDIGVPRWLPPPLRAHSVAIGVLETGDDSGAYDRRITVAPQPRPDPCAALRDGRN